MASFPIDDEELELDYFIARDGGAAAYLSHNALKEAEGGLDVLGYQRAEMDATTWADQRRLHKDFASTLAFPDYYGTGSLDGLNDCLGDVAMGEYGWDTSHTGFAITIAGFGPFAREAPDVAHNVTDILVGTSRLAMVFGYRVLWLLHVDDRDFRMQPVGAHQVSWNMREVFRADRQ